MSSASPARSADLMERLARADALVDRLDPHRRTLDPHRERATPLGRLAEELLDRDLPRGVPDAFVDGLVLIVEAQVEAFPENIFWDFDYLAASVLDSALASPRGAVTELVRAADLIASLQTLFGRESPIRFRYVHDFTYGFDWAKWVARDPESRAATGPFDLRFLGYMKRRGGELLELIARNDAKYPTLRDGRPRNPFGFSREPEDEVRLFRDLEAHDLLPVRCFDRNTTPRWDADFRALRAERAEALGL